MSEIRDIERRRTNLMIYNLAPPTPGEEPAPGAEKNVISELLTAIGLHPDGHGVVSISRIGRVVNGKPKALKVVFGSAESQRTVLAHARNLPACGDDRFTRISLKPDLTPAQQAAGKVLYQELKRQKEAGRNVRIRGGKIVEVTDDRPGQPRPAGSTSGGAPPGDHRQPRE